MRSLNSSPPEDLRLSELPVGEALPFFRELLERGRELRVRVTGRSMAPFLRGGEILTLVKVPPPSLRRGDLILFARVSGPPKLHRIIKVKRHSDGARVFITGGDALADYDAPVHDGEIVGKARCVEDPRSRRGPRDMESRGWRLRNGLAALAWGLKVDARGSAARIARRFRGTGAGPTPARPNGNRERFGEPGQDPCIHE